MVMLWISLFLKWMVWMLEMVLMIVDFLWVMWLIVLMLMVVCCVIILVVRGVRFLMLRFLGFVWGGRGGFWIIGVGVFFFRVDLGLLRRLLLELWILIWDLLEFEFDLGILLLNLLLVDMVMVLFGGGVVGFGVFLWLFWCVGLVVWLSIWWSFFYEGDVVVVLCGLWNCWWRKMLIKSKGWDIVFGRILCVVIYICDLFLFYYWWCCFKF